ncbi:YceI family protein [Streptomyces acidiscabies]|uniref:Lipid/polyisoprenoid-binding YceI-like domain-containing protein n=1 Tax=Streptomyces acidiscabies TaxID=42234 RepID=A0A0L0K3Z7_9ACTN|nr:YceI family protein [Streptomyces acidiscabies]KND32822.1 hypothetical protein IQ63_21985 [Streptomyces acidiscabies]
MTVAVATGIWQLDPTATTVALKHKTMWGLVTVKGVFSGVTGSGEVGEGSTATGVFSVDAASIDTKNTKRDVHLRSADFLDTDNHPEITYAVRTAELRGSDQVHVTGQLTVRGISRPHSFTAGLADASADAVTLNAEFVIDRKDFGLDWNQMGMMKDQTTITAALRFTRTG